MSRELREALIALWLSAVAVAVVFFLLTASLPGQGIGVRVTESGRVTTLDVVGPDPGEVLDGHLRIRGYRYRAGAWRVLVTHRGRWHPSQADDPLRLEVSFDLPAGWRPRWPDQTGLSLEGAPDNVWVLSDPDEHPAVPSNVQVLTPGMTLYWEFLEPGAEYTPALPSPGAVSEALSLLMVQPGKDSYWPRLRATRGLYRAPLEALNPSSPVVTLGEYVLGGWQEMYGASQDHEGPVFWLDPRWASHDLSNWHYAIPALCFEEYLRRGDTSSYVMGLEMARRLVTIGMDRGQGPYRGGFWSEKGLWPSEFWSPVPEKGWDISWVVAAILTPDDPIWEETAQIRSERLLRLDPAVVWPERYGARRPARVLRNLASIWSISDMARRGVLQAQARAIMNWVWSRVPPDQHFLHGDSSHGEGLLDPPAPAVKLFMQLQWAPACAWWLSRSVGTSHLARLRAMVKWQVDNWPENGRWPYVVTESAPLRRAFRYETSTACWAQPVLTLAANWWPQQYEQMWRENAERILPIMGPDPALGLDDRREGPGRLKTYSARLLSLRDPFLPRR